MLTNIYDPNIHFSLSNFFFIKVSINAVNAKCSMSNFSQQLVCKFESKQMVSICRLFFT